MGTLQGRRVYPPGPTEEFQHPVPLDCQPGDYWKDETSGVWYAECPLGWLGTLAAHQVTEHEDGTITVSPSILISKPHINKSWHGYLERGIWREV